MLNKNLINILNTVDKSKQRLFTTVFCQWLSQLAGISFICSFVFFISSLFEEGRTPYLMLIGTMVLSFVISLICNRIGTRASGYLAEDVKKKLRKNLFDKLFKIGPTYSNKLSTAYLVQLITEGVEQLRVYFANFLPQFFYSLLAPITLFIVVCFISVKAAVTLLICVPLIPILIIGVSKIAIRIIGRYWGSYTNLGETFLENLQGLTTLKIYQADDYRHKQMNDKSEDFRKMTMRVLTMQLNSITLMDIVAFTGAAVGISVALIEYSSHNINLSGTLIIILLSSDFFLPMRMLGSFFHVAMNGVASSGKIFELLQTMEENSAEKVEMDPKDHQIVFSDLSYSYDGKRSAVSNISLGMPMCGMISFVGQSGCGKSTLASLISGIRTDYSGSLKIGKCESRDIASKNRYQYITLVSQNSYIFEGTVRDNLLMGKSDATDSEMNEVLQRVCLLDFVNSQDGLDTMLVDSASNLSGGQQQRLALARALLHRNTEIYIFDEAFSNIDIESEEVILSQVNDLAKTKLVIIISHRLSGVIKSDCIYFMEKGLICEKGSHEQLMTAKGRYASLFNYQQSLENYGK